MLARKGAQTLNVTVYLPTFATQIDKPSVGKYTIQRVSGVMTGESSGVMTEHKHVER